MQREIPPDSASVILAAADLFGDLSSDEIAFLAKASRLVRIETGSEVFDGTGEGTGVYVLVAGEVVQAMIPFHGGNTIPDTIKAGQAFGHSELFHLRPRALYAQTTQDSILLHVDRQAIIETIRHNRDFGRHLAAVLTRKEWELMGKG